MYNGNHKKGEIEITKINPVYHNQFCTFYNDEVIFPNNKTGNFLRLEMAGGYSVAILPVTTDGKMVFIHTFRHAARGWGFEVPKGYGKTDEEPETTAHRELLEETGMKAEYLEYVGLYHESPSTLQYGLHCFIAHNCTLVAKQNLEYAETIEKKLFIVSNLKNLPSSNYKDAITELLVHKFQNSPLVL